MENMMLVNVIGGSKSQRKHTTKMVEFCVKKLMPKMKSLEVNVHIKDFKKDSSLGYAIPTDDADAHRPREFDVDIHSKQPLRQFLETLAHEMVHVKQFARGELYESTRMSKQRWMGEWLDKEPDYWDQPWEIEAHGRECGLFIRYCESHKLGTQKWTHTKY